MEYIQKKPSKKILATVPFKGTIMNFSLLLSRLLTLGRYRIPYLYSPTQDFGTTLLITLSTILRNIPELNYIKKNHFTFTTVALDFIRALNNLSFFNRAQQYAYQVSF